MKLPSSKTCEIRRGFSLIELLTVMAIIALLTAIAIPAVNGIKGGSDITRGAYEVFGALEQARGHAMAKNTYVLVGFQEVDASREASARPQVPGTGRLAVSVIASKTGLATYTNLAADFEPVMPLVRVENVHLTANTNSGAQLVTATSPAAFTFPLSGNAQYSFNKVIEFTPQGLARLQSANPTLSRGGVNFRLQPTKGPTLVPALSANYADLQIDSLSGAARISRP